MKLIKLLAAAVLLSIPSSAVAKPYPVREAAIVQVFCGMTTGTAFKVSEDKYVTAKHVIAGGDCTVDGKAIADLDLSDAGDFASFTGPKSPAVLVVNCKGFRAGKTYLAVGHGLGLPDNAYVPWIATDYSRDEYTTFMGDGLPGMSGGPVLNSDGEVVGTVNMRWPARSRALRDTPICE